MKTIKEASEVLAVSVSTVKRLLAERKLGHVKIGNCTRISQEQIDQYIKRNQVKAV